MANYSQTKYNFDGQYITGLQGLSTGTVAPWSTTTAPSGFLECNGQSVSTSTYAALFAVIGYTYGGSGASFNVPDLQDRVTVGKSNTKALASSMGANTVAPTGNVGGSAGATTLSSCQIPSHLHTMASAVGSPAGRGGCFGSRSGAAGGQTSNTGGGQSHSHNLSANFVGSANSVLQPYLVLMYIIKT
jgi:microcystin-dependent protein